MDVSRVRYGRRRLAFWGGLIIASIVGLQLLAKALSEFSLPDVTHPCLLVGDRGLSRLRECVDRRPWVDLWNKTRRMAEREPERGDWLSHARAARAAAVAYLVTGEPRYARRASQLLRRYPTPLYASRLECRELARVAIYWAQSVDLLHEYLRRRHELASASAALARLAQRLYYTHWRRDRSWQLARLWRAAGLVQCALALADWEPPAAMLRPQALYAEGRAELRGAMREAFGPAVVTHPRLLAEAFEAIIPAAIAIGRTAGDDVLDCDEIRRAARWALATRLPNGMHVGAKGQTGRLPAHLLAAAGLYPQVFAADAARSAPPVDACGALCLLPAVDQYRLRVPAVAAACGAAFALRVSCGGSEPTIVVAGQAELRGPRGARVFVPLTVWSGGEIVSGWMAVGIGARRPVPGLLKRFGAFAVAARAEAAAGGGVFATARWLAEGQCGRVEMQWVTLPAPAALVWVDGQPSDGDSLDIEMRLAPSSWAIAELGDAERCRLRGARWRGAVAVRGRPKVVSLAPRRLRWQLVEGTEAVRYRLEGPAMRTVWCLELPREGSDRLSGPGLSATAAGLLWSEEAGRLRDVLAVNARELQVADQVDWRHEPARTVYWSAGQRLASRQGPGDILPGSR